MMPVSLIDIAISNIQGVDYCCINGIGKKEAKKLLQNPDLTDERRVFFLKSKKTVTIYKMGKQIMFGDIENEKTKISQSKNPNLQ